MEFRRMMSYEGFESHVEVMEPKHQNLPHLGNGSRESTLAFDESMFDEERLRNIFTHLIPPDELAFALGV
ncbi:hypothetical protein KI387_044372 [Taxus chinensis]|uniref:Uncharacterized protein n=1 Tax=Taxus chinensis TaxID=29808 RepID=A0AA38GU64_TAXCH|nr:hypothetical protein KI387_044372 [Taxus chinensis]